MDTQSPWILRFMIYTHERFPLINGALFLIFYLTARCFVHYAISPSQPLIVNFSFLTGFFAIYFFFFHLRVFDEHKDYENDKIYYPKRILQSGLIRLRDLKILGALAVTGEALISAWVAYDALIVWLICFIYSLLMLKEFFVRTWLSQRLVLYAISHMAIMPLIVIWIACMHSPVKQIPSSVLWISFLSFFSGMAFEISRKIKAPEDERDGVLTYSKLLTPKGAAVSAWICLLLSTCVLAILIASLAPPAFVYGLLVLLLLYSSYIYFHFTKTLGRGDAKRLELGSSLFMLSAYLIIIILILNHTGMEWK